MYEKILLPLDGSTLSESAWPYAQFLARALQRPVELLHAIDPDIITGSVATRGTSTPSRHWKRA
jgi:nucleotide-binding universal stress UspA family protein